MSTSCKPGITGYYRGQALTLGLALLALNFSASAQPAGPPPIAFGQTVQGTLTSTDPVAEDGTPFDTYALTVTAPGQSFFIKASSPDIPVIVTLFRFLPGGGSGLQDASTFTGGQTLGMFGVLNQPGRYGIEVNAFSPQQPTGSYTLSLTNTPPPAAPPAQ